VASLGLVSPAGRQMTVSPLFSLKNWRRFYSHRYNNDLFSCRLITTPHLLTSCCPVFFVNSATIFFHSGVTLLDDVTRGGPPPVTSLHKGYSLHLCLNFLLCFAFSPYNSCHQTLFSGLSIMSLQPGPSWGSLQCSTDPLAEFGVKRRGRKEE